MKCKLKASLYRYSFFFVLNLLLVNSVYATDYYVSPNGSANWGNCTSVSTPCSAATAMVNAVAGDRVLFRGGTYRLEYDVATNGETFYWYNGALNPSNSGVEGNPITFMAYPGELPIMDVIVSSSWNTGRAFGVKNNNYIVYDGFKCICNGGTKVGGIVIMGNNAPGMVVTGNSIKNCIFDGGTTVYTTTDNVEPVRVEHTEGTVLSNNTIYSVRQISDWHNTSAMKFYHNNKLTINNNEIYNCSNGIYLKSDSDNVLIYNNFVHNNYRGGVIYILADNSSDYISIYNNVFANNSYASLSFDSNDVNQHAWGLKIFNNTYYNCPRGISYGYNTGGIGAIIYNNILYQVYSAETITGSGDISNIHECDHNQLGTTFKIVTHMYGTMQAIYTSLAAWQSSQELEVGGNPGVGSLSSNPFFANASGGMSRLDDFRLASNSPCKGAGRGGIDMGANIDLVGVRLVGVGDGITQDKPGMVEDFKLVQ